MENEEMFSQNDGEVNQESEKLIQELLNKRKMLEKKESEITSREIARDNEEKINKEKGILSILKYLQSIGVNLEDQSSISEFLNQLEQKDPDLRELFEYAINELTGEDFIEGQSEENETIS